MSANMEENKLNLRNALLLGIYLMTAQLTFLVSMYLAHVDAYVATFTSIAELTAIFYTIIIIVYIALLYVSKNKSS